MLSRRLFLFAFLIYGCFPSFLCAQVSLGGQPFSWQTENGTTIAAIPVSELPALDVEKTRLADAKMPGQNRFAAPVDADVDATKAGVWRVLPNGERIWQCQIRSAGALGLILKFDRFYLPAGSRFFAYTPDRKHLEGAYSAESCLPDGQFLVGVVPGDVVVLEYWEPARTPASAFRLHLNRVDCAYKQEGLAEFDFSDALPCHINVNCPQGSAWQQEKRGVARILMDFSNGAAWCTGTLIANSNNTFEPYFLTAHHCQLILLVPNFSLWRFDFEYEAPTCAQPATEPARRSVLGCERTAFRAESDMLLLKLNPLPNDYSFYFNGWNRSTATTQPHGTFIHHPAGDIKKISVDSQVLTIQPLQINWGSFYGISPPNSHWKVIPDQGVFQPGSSGCPLFDPQKRIIGQLHGGITVDQQPCNVISTFFGRFNQSWDAGTTPGTRLRDWLDPIALNNVTQNGYTRPVLSTYTISGKITTPKGIPIPQVRVVLTGPRPDSVLTDSLGNYSFKNLGAGFTYIVRPRLDTLPLNGVTTQDISLISQHILNLRPLATPWLMLAADANNSGTISTLDAVAIRRIILGIDENLARQPAWRFHRTHTVFPDLSNPFTGTVFQEETRIDKLERNESGIDFYGIKIGDVNNTVSVK